VTTQAIVQPAAVDAPDIISHWIDGRPVEVLPERTGPVYDPATGQVIARVPRGGASEVDAAVNAARAAFPAWRDLPLLARSQVFFAYRELVWRHREQMAELITRDHGKTYPDALGEVVRGVETIEFACGLPVHMAGLNTPNVATNVDTFGDLSMRGEDGIRFFTKQKEVTERWPEPGRRDALSLVFPGNR
jgi:malonate-semialdehyde dehydrogenase (acetylating)/methylmalonate-semialdehyde dehydrogenase